jgi:predicted nucleotidyltransferase
MTVDIAEFVPSLHRNFLKQFIEFAAGDVRIVGVAIGGSYLAGAMDEFSDIDLVIAVEPNSFAQVMDERKEFANSCGQILAAFTGEHVGEPRLLVCLYGDPLLHVDLKFVSIDDLVERVEDPEVLWERDNRITRALNSGAPEFPTPDPQWIEDRFWVWAHYCAAKIGRGELFEALDGLAFLRKKVLGPLCLLNSGSQPSGVRKLETVVPQFAEQLRETVAGHNARECIQALRACINLYLTLRPHETELTCLIDAQNAATAYLIEIELNIKKET